MAELTEDCEDPHEERFDVLPCGSWAQAPVGGKGCGWKQYGQFDGRAQEKLVRKSEFLWRVDFVALRRNIHCVGYFLFV